MVGERKLGIQAVSAMVGLYMRLPVPVNAADGLEAPVALWHGDPHSTHTARDVMQT